MKRLYFNIYVKTIVLLAMAFSAISCQKEITIDYKEIAPLVMIEGRVSNEGTYVLITNTRSVNDSVKGECLVGANVSITTADGVSHAIEYNPSEHRYSNTLTGVPGQTYYLSVDYEGKHYEASSVMPFPAPIKSAGFMWQTILDERLLVYEVWAFDPQPEERNCFRYRMDRKSSNPLLKGRKSQNRAFRSSTFEDRGHPQGLIFNDVMCMSEKKANETKEDDDDWEYLLHDGDTIIYSLMTIDRPTYEFFRSLSAGQGDGANPKSNINGGCLGYFAACNISRADTVVFFRKDVK